MTILVTPDAASMSITGMGSRSMPAERKAESLAQIKRDPIFIASHWKDSDVFFHAAGTEKVGDVQARIVDVSVEGTALRWFVDPQSGHILKQTYRTVGQSGAPAEGETTMENWKSIAGLTLPVLRKNKQNGDESSVAEYTAIELNPTVDPKIFDKPADDQKAQ